MIVVKPHVINLILSIIILLVVSCLGLCVIHNNSVNIVFVIYVSILSVIAITLLLRFINKRLIFHNEKIISYSIFRKKLVIEWKEVSKIIIQSDVEKLSKRPLRGKTAIICFRKKKLAVQSYSYGYSEMIRYINSFYDYKIKYIDKEIPVIRLFR